MQEKIKNYVVTFGFVVIVIAVFILNIIVEDKKVSDSERRVLANFPEFSFERLVNGKFIEEFEDYTLDQFIARDFFRKIKSKVSFNILMQKDNNGLFEKDNAIYKIEYPLKEKQIEKSADKLNYIYDRYFQGMNVYYAIIPDKNYYLEDDSILKMDYTKLKEIMQSKLINFKYIDIWNDLSLEDYYRTDIHWKQESLKDVVRKLEISMGLNKSNFEEYTFESQGDFYGSYYGQIVSSLKPDELITLHSDSINNSYTYNYETKKIEKIYGQKVSSDKYDTYLSGATSIITIENPDFKGNKELIIFRDSFGSSLAPLLIENYSKITLIDIRYISSQILDQYINFENQDVLFIYSSLVLNQNVFK